MSPSRPYFVEAIFNWILDNELTPFLSVHADFPGTLVPQAYVEDGQITLNISPSAVNQFFMDKQAISFSARFSGIAQEIYIPMGAIVGLYARENGHGMAFPDEPFYLQQVEEAEQADSAVDSADARSDSSLAPVSQVDNEHSVDHASDESTDAAGNKKGSAKSRSHLTVIK